MTTSRQTAFNPQESMAWDKDPFHNFTVNTLPTETNRVDQAIEVTLLEILAEDAKKLLVTSSSSIIPNTSSSGSVSLIDRMAEGYSSELNDALRDLRDARDEAREEGFLRPSDIALENADRLLREMYRISPRRFEVYPTPDGEIAIDAPDGQGRSVILLCDSEGGALCMVHLNSHHRRARYSTTETLPDGFVHEALDDLKR